MIDVKTRIVTKVGEPGMITSLDASPDAKYFRVTYLDQPFSYLLPVANFGNHEVIIDGTGKVLRAMGKRELSEGQATDIVDPNDPNGGGGGGGGGRGRGNVTEWTKRDLAWHPFESGLMFVRSARGDSAKSSRRTARTRAPTDAVRAADAAVARWRRRRGGGRGARPTRQVAATRPDSLILWTAPFSDATMKALYVTPGPGTINGVSYSENGRIMFVHREGRRRDDDRRHFPRREQRQVHGHARWRRWWRGGRSGRRRAGGRGGRGGGGGGPASAAC